MVAAGTLVRRPFGPEVASTRPFPDMRQAMAVVLYVAVVTLITLTSLMLGFVRRPTLASEVVAVLALAEARQRFVPKLEVP